MIEYEHFRTAYNWSTNKPTFKKYLLFKFGSEMKWDEMESKQHKTEESTSKNISLTFNHPFTYTYIARQEGRQKIFFILNYNTAWFLHWNKCKNFTRIKKTVKLEKHFPTKLKRESTREYRITRWTKIER